MEFWKKFKTFQDYVFTGLRIGADLRSRYLLVSMLPRLKYFRLNPSHRYRVNICLNQLKKNILVRAADIFILHEVLGKKPYIYSKMKEKPPRRILDLGAHIGLATLLFKAEFPDAEIHCYEPEPENFELLQFNTKGLHNVFVHCEAVGSKRTKATLYIPENRYAGASLRPASKGERVRKVVCQVKPLDEILTQIGDRVDLIKFDIEGMEYEVFSTSRLVHEVPWIVGEIKGDQQEVQRFIQLFPQHRGEVMYCSSKMVYIYLNKKMK